MRALTELHHTAREEHFLIPTVTNLATLLVCWLVWHEWQLRCFDAFDLYVPYVIPKSVWALLYPLIRVCLSSFYWSREHLNSDIFCTIHRNSALHHLQYLFIIFCCHMFGGVRCWADTINITVGVIVSGAGATQQKYIYVTVQTQNRTSR